MRTLFSFSTTLACVIRLLLGAALSLSPMLAAAFNSGSTGADGDFKPTADKTLQLPANGTFNFKSVNIPAGVTVNFQKNAANTPVYMLSQGDITIAGTLDVSGGKATDQGSSGVGGPGGFDGGAEGVASDCIHNTPNTGIEGGSGLGPGGGFGGKKFNCNDSGHGGGGSFGIIGGPASGTLNNQSSGTITAPIYGNELLQPLIGGSGGGGANGTKGFFGKNGGGGGGAVLLASSGSVSITGSVLAEGGKTWTFKSYNSQLPSAGCGSGGAIRIVATQLIGNGIISAKGGTDSTLGCNFGGNGRIRIEAEANHFTNLVASTPASFSLTPGPLFVANLPTLAITRIAGIDVTANAQVAVPMTTTNPVEVIASSSGIPVGTVVNLTVKPDNAADRITAPPIALTGTTNSATSTLSVALPDGPSTMEASTSFALTASAGDALAPYANNERVEKVTLTASTDGPGVAILTTVSGKTYRVPQSVLPKS